MALHAASGSGQHAYTDTDTDIDTDKDRDKRGSAGDIEWRQIMVDSGAAISVAPKRMVENTPMDQPPTQQVHRAAKGGGKNIRLVTTQGEQRVMSFRIAKTTKPLASMSKISARGNHVVFVGPDSRIERKIAVARRSGSREVCMSST